MACVPGMRPVEELAPVYSVEGAVPTMLCMPGASTPVELAQPAKTKPAVHKRGGRKHRRSAGSSRIAEAVAGPEDQPTDPQALAGDDGLGVAGCAELVSQLGTGERQPGALARLRDAFARLAFDAQGCRVAQAALDSAGRHEHAELAAELRGRVRESLASPHANFVVQKMVEVMPPGMVAFVAEELAGVAVDTAQHRFACRGICRLLEHCPHDMTQVLVNEILREAPTLCRHKYGNYVIQLILEHGSMEQRQAVVQTLLKDPLGFACHRTGSDVVEHALASYDLEERGALLRAFLRDPASFADLSCSHYGSFVARALVCLPGAEGAEARAMAAEMLPRLHSGKHGKRVAAELVNAVSTA